MPITLRVAGVLWLFVGIGFGVFCIPAIREIGAGRDIPIVMGFPAYGRGPFERIGIETSVPLLAAFLIVCILECVAGVLLFFGLRSGAVLSLVMIPFGAVFWLGFALPFAPILGGIAVVLTILGWSSLH